MFNGHTRQAQLHGTHMHISLHRVNVHTQLAAVESFFNHSEDTQMLVFTLP